MSTPVTPEIQRRSFNIHHDEVNNINNISPSNIVQLNNNIDNIISNINIINRNLIESTSNSINNTNSNIINNNSNYNNNSNRSISRTNSNSYINDEHDPQYSQRQQAIENNTRIYAVNLMNSRSNSNQSLSKLQDTPSDVININDIGDNLPSISNISNNNSRNADILEETSSINGNRSSSFINSVQSYDNQSEESIINSYIRSSENVHNVNDRNEHLNNESENENNNMNNHNEQSNSDINNRANSNEVRYRLVEVSPGVFQMVAIIPNIESINITASTNTNIPNPSIASFNGNDNGAFNRLNLYNLISNRIGAHESMVNNYINNELNN
ncbi:hypothetical protein PIROE2DRAFT_4347, partial [Piromyces sp. E2]